MPVKGDSEYKQFYYDLASLEKDVRLKAANGLLAYLQEKVSSNELDEYHKYTVERLIKGLASSRDAARQGFSIVLCEVLKKSQVPISTVLALIDKNMLITSSLDGHEERDMMFGILFGYMIIIRSGRLSLKTNTDSSVGEQVNKIFERIWSLHNKRNWIQEITIETLLSLMETYPHPTFLSTCLDKIKTYLSVDLEQQSANHLLLKLGLAFISKQQKVIEQQVTSKLDTLVSFELATELETYAPALINACKKFPQVHKVWDYLLGFVFSLTAERELPASRLDTLSTEAQEHFDVLTTFLATHLWVGSKEKRATAMKLTESLFRIVPSSLIPLLLTPQAIHSILVCRGKGRGGGGSAGGKGSNLLFEFAGGVLNNMVKMVMGGESAEGADGTKGGATKAGDEASKLALLTVLSQHSRGQFDQQSHTHTIQTLTSSLSGEGLGVYVDLLASSLIGTLDESNATSFKKMEEGSDDENSDAEDTEDEDDTTERVAEYRKSLLLSLVSLAKAQIFAPTPTPSTLVVSLVSVLLRMAMFQEGKTKKPKKKGVANGDGWALVGKVEDSALLSSLSTDEVHLLSLHTQSLVTDLFMKAGGKGGKGGVSGMYSVWCMFVNFVSSLSLRVSEAGEGEEEDKEGDIGTSVTIIDKHIQNIYALYSKNEGGSHNGLSKFCEASISLLVLCTLHHCFHHDISLSSLVEGCEDISRIVQEVTAEEAGKVESKDKAKGKKGKAGKEESDDESEEGDGSEMSLFEFSMDLLSSVSEVASRGVREGVKRVWGAYLPLMTVAQQQGEVVDRMVGMVLEVEEDGEEEGAEEEMDVEDEQEGEQDEEDDEEELPKNSKKKAESKKEKSTPNPKKATKQEESDDDEQDDKEDIMIQEDDMFAFLMSANKDNDLAEEDSDAENDGVLVHTAEADAALAHMIATRKEHRKAGLLAAKNKQLLLRMRVLDILEVFIHKTTEDYVVMCMYRPMLLAYRKTLKSKVLEQLSVGPAFISRLEGVIGQELLKRKLNLAFPTTISTCPADEVPHLLQESVEEFGELLQSIQHCIHSKDVRLRHVAQEYIVALARSVSGVCGLKSEEQIQSHTQTVDKMFTECVVTLLSTFITKRRSDVTGKWLDNLLITRHPAFFLPRVWEVLLTGVSTSMVYARGMVCEMVSTLVKRCGGGKLDTSISSVVFAHLGALVEHLSEGVKSLGVESEAKGDDKKDNKKASKGSKHNKPVLQLLKTVLELLSSEKFDKKHTHKHLRVIKASLETIHQALVVSGEGNKHADECKGLVEKVRAVVKSVEESGVGSVEVEPESKKGKSKEKASKVEDKASKTESKADKKKGKAEATKKEAKVESEDAKADTEANAEAETEGDGKKKRDRKRSMSEDSTASTSSRVTRSGRAGVAAAALPVVAEEDSAQKKKKTKK